MTDYEYLFSTNLHAKLKERIQGGIFVKVNENDSLVVAIKRKDGSSSTEESIKASAKDVIPVIEALVKSGRYFSKNHDYQTLGDVVVKESQSLSMIPDDFITEELVDYAIESKIS